jgi:hypothetical protein
MKIIKPGSRPFIALGIVFGLILLLPLYLGLGLGKWADSAKMGGSIIVLGSIIIGPIALVRVEVDEHEICLRKYGVFKKQVRFDMISHSYTNILGEKDWPLSVTLVGKDGKEELMTINLKVFQKEDVSWLLSNTKLKVLKEGYRASSPTR